jgi:hypothetical protein
MILWNCEIIEIIMRGNMLEFDEDISTTRTTSDEKCTFLNRKSILHYKDENFNGKLYDSLESKIKKHYEDRKDIEIEFKSFNNYKKIEIVITINFKKEDEYYHLTEDFKKDFKEVYEKYKE